jgi:ribose 5-phosphate isomerase B
MKIIIGSDHFGYPLKEEVISYLKGLNHEVIDMGVDNPDTPVDYPDIAEKVAVTIAEEKYERGILICGTGIGMAMVANKVPGVRAACCHDPYSAERARKSNNAQILTMGSQIVAPVLARVLLDHWLNSEFLGGRSASKVAKINAIDKKYHQKMG